MSTQVLFFSGSNHSKSIHQSLLECLFNIMQLESKKMIKLVDFQLPMYSQDLENERSFSADLQMLRNIIKEHSALVIAINEHNGTVSAFFKNYIDWLSRLDRNFLENKKVFLVSTSPGARGGKTALEYCKMVFPRFGAEIAESFSFPSFYDNFSVEEKKITNEVLNMGVNDMLSTFEHHLNV